MLVWESPFCIRISRRLCRKGAGYEERYDIAGTMPEIWPRCVQDEEHTPLLSVWSVFESALALAATRLGVQIEGTGRGRFMSSVIIYRGNSKQ